MQSDITQAPLKYDFDLDKPKSLLERIKYRLKMIWIKYNPFDVGDYIDRVNLDLERMQRRVNINIDATLDVMDRLEEKVSARVERIERHLIFSRLLLDTFGRISPDLLWVKDIKGNYIFANDNMRNKILHCSNPIGMSDMDIFSQPDHILSGSNSKFREYGIDSDAIIIDLVERGKWFSQLEQGIFYYSAKIFDKRHYFKVMKHPLMLGDSLIGVCGTAVDLTPYMENKESEDIMKYFNMDAETLLKLRSNKDMLIHDLKR